MTDLTRILVAEDNDFVRMQLCRFLADGGYEVVEAESGLEADEVCRDRQQKIAAAIVDVRMEPMSGIEFIRGLRADNITTPVIMITGDQKSDVLNEASKWNAAAVLMKPVQKERLLKTVERVVAALSKNI